MAIKLFIIGFKKEDEEVREGKSQYRIVSFERHSLSKEDYEGLNDDYWATCELPLLPVEVSEEGLIENQEGTIMTG